MNQVMIIAKVISGLSKGLEIAATVDKVNAKIGKIFEDENSKKEVIEVFSVNDEIE